MIGLLGLLGVLFQQLKVKNELLQLIGIIAILLFLSILSVRTVVRNTNWKDAITLYSHDIQILEDYNVAANLSTEFRNEGRIDDALKYMKKSAELVPYEVNINNLGSLYDQKGDKQKAKMYYLKTINAKSLLLPLHKHNEIVYINSISFLIRNNELTDANRFEEIALKDYPNSSNIWLLKAFLEDKFHNHGAAVDAAYKAYQINNSSMIQSIYLKLSNNQSIDGIL
jgi:tetratricopeptide (TPR) repeat protein